MVITYPYRPDITDEDLARHRLFIARQNARPGRGRRLRTAWVLGLAGLGVAIAALAPYMVPAFVNGTEPQLPWYMSAVTLAGAVVGLIGLFKWENNRERYEWEIFD